jgi:hypothetical protein
MAGITTAMSTSFKSELMSAGHCFNATVFPTATVASGSTSVTAVSSMTGVAVGMGVTGTGMAANATIAAVTGSNTFTLSAAATAAVNGGTLTVAGDVFKMALIRQGMTGTYDSTTTNYSNVTGNTDEVTNASGTAYVAGGTPLTNVSPTTSGTVAFVNFSPNPSWTTATFSTAGCMIYNSSVRNGGLSGTNSTGGGRSCSVHNFGGSQQVSSGTFTVLMPTADSLNAILRLS